jgi:hypothetical protein
MLVLATTPCLGTTAALASPPRGRVVGRIEACSGLGYANQAYAGGTVFALRGEVRSVRISRAIVKTVLPSDVVARQRVPTAGEFGFSLVPGRYVIDLAHYARGNVPTWASVTIRSGETSHVDLPNRCM